MEHFSGQAWADFVRGISNSERDHIEAHLANGCNDCAAARDIWTQVHTMALREAHYTPPKDAVRKAKLEYAARSFESCKQPVLAKLVFDTFKQPALAGVRSAATAARQMVYEAEGMAVDLRFDEQPAAKKIFLTGQVLDRQVPRASLDDAAVIVWTDRGLALAETKANAFGEFSLELEPQANLRLSIQVIGRALIRIPLADLKPEPRFQSDVGGSEVSN
jgi:hypothetical protein